jgi:tetratricopeptide (TPR) repeat protein
MLRVALCLALALGCVCFAVPTHAQDAINARDRREAKRLFDQAHLAYRRGDYEEAILKWQESFDLSKEPLIFESIANAYERLGDLESAHKYLSQWRQHAPKAEHKELDSRLESLTARLEEKRARDRKQQEEEARRRNEEQDRLRREQASPRPQPTTGVEETDTSAMAIGGWSLIGVGVSAVLVGVILDAVAAARRPSEDLACKQALEKLYCLDENRDDIESSDTLAIAGDITWIIGAAAAAAGIALVIVASQTSGGDESARVETVPRPGGISIAAHY